MDDWCPWLIRRKGEPWLCKIENDVCTHTHFASCTRYENAMKIINDPLSQELLKKAIESDLDQDCTQEATEK